MRDQRLEMFCQGLKVAEIGVNSKFNSRLFDTKSCTYELCDKRQLTAPKLLIEKSLKITILVFTLFLTLANETNM